jgi:threonine/homoserine/homoserine lactone efflux protein
LYLAYSTYRSWKSFDPNIPLDQGGPQRSVLKAALVNLLNPNPYIFWSLVTGPILLAGWRETPLHGAGFVAGFYVTMILGLCTFILVFGLARHFGPRLNRVLLGLSALTLFFFGLYQLWNGMMS